MDLLKGMFDKNLRSHITWKKIKRDDPKFRHACISLARDPRNKQSITAAADIRQLGIDIGNSANLKDLLLDDLHCLDITQVDFTHWMFAMLCRGINGNRSIEELTVSNFSHNQWAIGQMLGPLLANNPSLRSLVVMTGGGYTRSAENMRRLVLPLMERGAPLDELAFVETGVNDDMVAALVEVFLGDPGLVPRKLELSACEFGFVGCQKLSELLAHPHCSVETLVIDSNYICDAGAFSLALALRRNSTLKALSIADNPITERGWGAFSSCSCYVSRQSGRIN